MVPRDFGESFSARVTGDGATSRYTLPRDNIDGATVSVYIDGSPVTVLNPGTPGSLQVNEYVLDERLGVVTLWDDLPLNSVLVVEGTAFTVVLPTDMSSYVDTAFNLHVIGLQPVPTIDDLNPVEEYLVAMLAVVELLWALATEASGEIDILTPEGVNIPVSQRFAQYVTLIERIQGHYKELAASLNVGPYRIQMFSLRRVSRTTGRLVPIYVPQEFDDRTYPPTRVLPPIDSGLT